MVSAALDLQVGSVRTEWTHRNPSWGLESGEKGSAGTPPPESCFPYPCAPDSQLTKASHLTHPRSRWHVTGGMVTSMPPPYFNPRSTEHTSRRRPRSPRYPVLRNCRPGAPSYHRHARDKRSPRGTNRALAGRLLSPGPGSGGSTHIGATLGSLAWSPARPARVCRWREPPPVRWQSPRGTRVGRGLPPFL